MNSLWRWCRNIVMSRPEDVLIGGADNPYLYRWFVIPRNRFFNIYIHGFARSDDDRALHDHPWMNLSIVLRGSYIEHTIDAGGVHRLKRLNAGAWRFRASGRLAHRVEIDPASTWYLLPGVRCWTLFITGPRYRDWGFHCPEKGWVHWQAFTAPGDATVIGKGCDD